MVMPMVDIRLMRMRMFNYLMYVRMRVEATIWNLLFCMVVYVMTVIVPVCFEVRSQRGERTSKEARTKASRSLRFNCTGAL
jgi:hypothetical protein